MKANRCIGMDFINEIEDAIAAKRQERSFAEKLRVEAHKLGGDPFCFELKIAFCRIEEETMMWMLQKLRLS